MDEAKSVGMRKRMGPLGVRAAGPEAEALAAAAAAAEWGFVGGDSFGGGRLERRSEKGNGKGQDQGGGSSKKGGIEWKHLHAKKTVTGTGGGAQDAAEQGPSDPALRLLWGSKEWSKHDYER